MQKIVPTVAMMVLASASTAFGQIGNLWTYEELFAKADLVVIAQRGHRRPSRVDTHLSPVSQGWN